MATVGSYIERWGPSAIAAGGFIALVAARNKLAPLMNGEETTIDLTNLYVAVFDWTAIQTGFLFGVYGYLMGRSDGFAGDIRHTTAMRSFSGYMLRATWIGFFLTITSLPLIIFHNAIDISLIYIYVFISVWFSVFIWAFLAFIRVAYIFGLILRVPDKKRILG